MVCQSFSEKKFARAKNPGSSILSQAFYEEKDRPYRHGILLIIIVYQLSSNFLMYQLRTFSLSETLPFLSTGYIQLIIHQTFSLSRDLNLWQQVEKREFYQGEPPKPLKLSIVQRASQAKVWVFESKFLISEKATEAANAQSRYLQTIERRFLEFSHEQN